MFDPLTVVCEIKYPWWRKSNFDGSAVRDTFIRIWHKDPCKDGTDSSCYHRNIRRKLNRYEKALSRFIYEGEIIFDNRPHYPDSREHQWFGELKNLRREWVKRRSWHIPWRLHFWHYRIQIPPLQMLWRWMFVRCAVCHKRFDWGEEVIGSWSGNSIWHFECDHKLRPLSEKDSKATS